MRELFEHERLIALARFELAPGSRLQGVVSEGL